MSKIIKPKVKNATGPYWKTAFIITFPLLLLMVSTLLFSYIYPNNEIIPLHAWKKSDSNGNKPVFVNIGSYTVNLTDKDGTLQLQATVTLKLSQPGLDEKIKANIPEIKHHVNQVMQNMPTSELVTTQGKEKLALQIKQQLESLIFQTASETFRQQNVPTAISEVLFTSMLIQNL